MNVKKSQWKKSLVFLSLIRSLIKVLEQDLEGRTPCFLVGAKNKKKDVEV